MNQPELRLSLLGGVTITKNGRTLSNFASRKVEALLAYLVCNPRPHPRETLATLLWPNNDQTRALANLSVALSSLRKQLRPYLLADRHTIGFNMEMGLWLDTADFQQSITQARETQKQRGKLDRSGAAQLATAVSLYKGDFLAGFTIRGAPEFEVWALLEQERLRQMLLTALADLIIFHQQRQQIGDGIRYAQQLLAIDSLQEEAHRQLMRFYAQNNQRAAALAQYEQCAAVLADELGVEPDEETTVLYDQIQAGERESGGTEVIAPLHPSPSAPQHNLPTAVTSFIGREDELARIDDWLGEADGRLLTIIGPGGMGKTRLAQEAARAQLGQFMHGVWFVSLVPVQDENGFMARLADAIGLKFSGTMPPSDQIVNFLRNKEMLLALDNFEQLLDGTAVDIVSDIIRQAPELKLLITSRGRLNLQTETLLDLHGLPVPESADDPQLAAFAAVKLFVARANRLRADFALNEGNRTSIYQICRLVEGWPLALELAASWIRVLSVAEIVVEIERGLDTLTTTLRDVPDRHRSVRAVFNQSWQLLTKLEQDLYLRLAVFRGGFTMEAARQVAGASLSLLSGLIDQSLLRRDETGRYLRHPLLVEFAAEKLERDPAGQTAVLQRHADYFAAWMQPKTAEISRMETAVLRQIRAEAENLRAAWDWAVQQAHAPFFSKIWLSFYHYLLDMEALHTEGVQRFKAAVTAVEQRPDAQKHQRLIAQLWSRFGWYHLELNQVETARMALEKSLEIARAGQFRGEEAYAFSHLGIVNAWQGNLAPAQEILEESVRLCRTYEEARPELASALNHFGIALQYQGEHAASIAPCEESAQLARASGNLPMLDAALTNLGAAWFHLDEYENARHAFEESLGIERRLGNRSRQAVNLHNLMEVAWKQADFAAARKFGQEAIALFEEVQQKQYLALTFSNMAEIELADGSQTKAGDWQRQAIIIAQELEAAWIQISVMVSSTQLLLAMNHGETAVKVLSFVINNEAAFAEHRERAQELLAKITPKLPSAQLEQAQAAAETSTLNRLLAELGAVVQK